MRYQNNPKRERGRALRTVWNLSPVERSPSLTLRVTGAVLICLGGVANPAFAQREIRLRTVPEMPLPFVTTVVAPAASHAAVSDVAGVLAVGNRPKSPTHVSLFRLDAQGQIVPGDPVTITLQKPESFGTRPNRLLGLLCHPRLPLLYVWQDVEALPDNLPTDPSVSAEFDHLLVYSLEEPQPKLLLAAARGLEFTCGLLAGGFALNPAATRLYVPNTQQGSGLQISFLDSRSTPDTLLTPPLQLASHPHSRRQK